MFDDWPLPAAFAALFVIVMLRANATYWAGRAISAGARKSRLARRMNTSGYLRAENLIRRWGAPAVSLSFLTVGFQTVMNAAAGVLRMPLRRYLPAVIIGGLMWALLYATVGLAVIEAALGGAVSWYIILGLVLVVVVATAVFNRRSKARARALPDSQ